MDQDSLIGPGLIDAYSIAIARDPSLTCLSPAISTDGVVKRKGGVVPYAITSGNLVRMRLFDEIGLYDEELFIDCIDFDFSLRVRRAGYCVCRIPEALIVHELGEAVQLPALAKKFYARHSPVRRYYMYRNYMYLMERYLVAFPAFVLKLGVLQFLLLPLIGMYDRDPVRSYRAIARGFLDYFARRHGPWTEPGR
jgi:rhamnosyltransferase